MYLNMEYFVITPHFHTNKLLAFEEWTKKAASEKINEKNEIRFNILKTS